MQKCCSADAISQGIAQVVLKVSVVQGRMHVLAFRISFAVRAINCSLGVGCAQTGGMNSFHSFLIEVGG
jgi:hypothetical protein